MKSENALEMLVICESTRSLWKERREAARKTAEKVGKTMNYGFQKVYASFSVFVCIYICMYFFIFFEKHKWDFYVYHAGRKRNVGGGEIIVLRKFGGAVETIS